MKRFIKDFGEVMCIILLLVIFVFAVFGNKTDLGYQDDTFCSLAYPSGYDCH